MPSAGTQRRAVDEGHRLPGVGAVEAVPGSAAATGAAGPARGPPGEHDIVARHHIRHAVPDRLDRARGFVTEEKGEVVVDRTLPIVEVGVAHAASRHLDHRLTGTGVRDHHVGDGDGLTLSGRHHAADSLRHSSSPCSARLFSGPAEPTGRRRPPISASSRRSWGGEAGGGPQNSSSRRAAVSMSSTWGSTAFSNVGS